VVSLCLQFSLCFMIYFCSCLRCLCLRSPPSHNPHPHFHYRAGGVAFAVLL
jgi:hypothetical protein